jgi:hypothetical protein
MNGEGEDTTESVVSRAVEAISEGREVGELEALLQDKPQYILIAYQLYPNGITADEFLQDTEVARQLGEATGLGPPTDPKGWGLWEADKVIERNTHKG